RVASFVLPLALGLYGLSWYGRLPGPARGRLAVRRVEAYFSRLLHDLSELRHSPRYLRLVLAGQLAALAGLAGLTLSSVLSLLRALVGSYDPPSLFRLSCGLLALVGVVCSILADRAAPVAAPGPDDFTESLAAARHLPPIVDLEEPLPAS